MRGAGRGTGVVRRALSAWRTTRAPDELGVPVSILWQGRLTAPSEAPAGTAPRRPSWAGRRGVQEAQCGGLERAVAVDVGALQRLVGTALARLGDLARGGHASADGRARFAWRGVEQFVRGDGQHLDVQVDAVEQRAAELALVAQHLVGRAAAGLAGRTQVSAGARIHGRDELEARREFGAARRAGDGDGAALQRLAQRLQRGARELRELVEEQHAVVRQRDLARPRRRSAAHQGDGAGGVVRAAGGPTHPLRGREAPGQARHGRALQRLVDRHVRQQPGEAVGQHRLARAGRAHHQQAVLAGRGDLQHAPGAGMALDVGQVGAVRGGDGAGVRLQARPAVAGRLQGRIALGRRRAELPDHVEQVARAVDLGPGHQRGLAGAVGRQHQARGDALREQRQGHGQGAAHRPQFARERELAREFVGLEPRRLDLPARGQDAQRDGQVEAARILGQVGRREVDGDALVVGELQPRVLDGRAHALARLLDFHVGQPDEREAGQSVGQVDLDRDRGRLQAEQGAALHQRQTHCSSPCFR
jgi:hypothetical protein